MSWVSSHASHLETVINSTVHEDKKDQIFDKEDRYCRQMFDKEDRFLRQIFDKEDRFLFVCLFV